MNNTCQSNLIHRSVRISAAWLLPFLLLSLPALVQAQFNYTTNNGTITITGYTGPGGVVTIPGTINGLPVTSIGDVAFYNGGRPLPYTLICITIPDSVTSIGDYAFAWNDTLCCGTLGNGLRSIGTGAFAECGLSTITIPGGVTSIGDEAFAGCGQLNEVYFDGNAPSLGGTDVFFDDHSYVYYLFGTTGWEDGEFGGQTLRLWIPPDGWLYTTTNGTITIGGYGICCCAAVTIPGELHGLPVTSIGDEAFYGYTSLTNITIPNTITSIGNLAFYLCTSLTNVTIPGSVTSIAASAFGFCDGLTGVFFQGNAPSLGSNVFENAQNVTVYYLPGTTGWGTTFGGRPTAPWVFPNPLILTGPSFGVQSNQFGFIISWATNTSVVVEASTDLASASWAPLRTCTLTNGSAYFSDPQWANYPARFYRVRSP